MLLFFPPRGISASTSSPAFINLHFHFRRFSIPISKHTRISLIRPTFLYLFIHLCRSWRLHKTKILSTGKFAANFFVDSMLFFVFSFRFSFDFFGGCQSEPCAIFWCIVMVVVVAIWAFFFYSFLRLDLFFLWELIWFSMKCLCILAILLLELVKMNLVFYFRSLWGYKFLVFYRSFMEHILLWSSVSSFVRSHLG